MSFFLEWLSDTFFVWLLALGSIGTLIFIFVRDKDTNKEKEKID